jgi:hypothetical protein
MEGLTFMSIPLEIRHQIFGYASARNEAPKKVLRRWFEKKEVKEAIAQIQASNPTGPTPVASYDTRDPYEEDTDLEEAEAEEVQEQEDEDEDSENEEQEDDEENEAEDQDMDEQNDDDDGAAAADDDDTQGEEVEVGDGELDEPPAAQDDGGAMDDVEESQQDVTETTHSTPSVQDDESVDDQVANETHGVEGPSGASTDTPTDTQADEGADENMDAEDEDTEGAESNVANNGQSDEEDADDGDDMAVDDGNNTAATSIIPPPAAIPPPRPAPVVRPHHKWRHIPKFLRISQCPPPPELFLTCKELNREAKDWFYDTAIIRIDATGSFQHYTMFEHSLDQIVDAVFSPFESVRKVEVKFVWDTEWIRAHSNGFDDLFESLLHMRADHVIQVLRRAPELREVVIDWHDSINDDRSTNLKHNISEKFTELAEEKLMQDKFITVNMNEHYLEAGKKPHRKSTLGRKRIEFQTFADVGFEFK